MIAQYQGYEVYRNSLTKRFYAIPIGDDDMTRKLTADTATELRRAIDAVVSKRRPNPWELPYATAPSVTGRSIALVA
jgi:hypothetical protein